MIKVLIAVCIFFLSGCGRTIQKQPTTITPNRLSLPRGEYKISPLDILEISVYQEEDLTKLTRVSSFGHISYPLLGQVKVSGLTVSEIEDKITKLLTRDYLVNPQVTIFIEEYHLNEVYVLGAVKEAGSYEFPSERPLTILEAISLAGGFSEVAAKKKIRIIRWEEGVEKTIKVNTNDITKKGDKSKDVILKPNDIIFVPESFF